MFPFYNWASFEILYKFIDPLVIDKLYEYSYNIWKKRKSSQENSKRKKLLNYIYCLIYIPYSKKKKSIGIQNYSKLWFKGLYSFSFP